MLFIAVTQSSHIQPEAQVPHASALYLLFLFSACACVLVRVYMLVFLRYVASVCSRRTRPSTARRISGAGKPAAL
jgi:hypothetical protein